MESKPSISFRHQKRKYKLKSYHLRERLINRQVIPCVRNPMTKEFQQLSADEEEKYKPSLYKSIKHKLLHYDWIMFDMQYGINLHDFIQSIVPLRSINTKIIKKLNSHDFVRDSGLLKPIFMMGSHSNVAMFNQFQESTNKSSQINHLVFNKYQDVTTALSDTIPSYLQSLHINKMNELPIVIDTGASTLITPVLGDFVGDLKPTHIEEFKQLSGNTKDVGKGIVEWEIRDLWNVSKIIRTEAYYIPEAIIRLFSPPAYFQATGGGKYLVEERKMQLNFKEGESLEFPYNHCGNLPLMLTSSQLSNNAAGARMVDDQVHSNSQILITFMSVVEQTNQMNQSLTSSQKELLLLHQKLGHINLQWTQRLCGKNRITKKSILSTKIQTFLQLRSHFVQPVKWLSNPFALLHQPPNPIRQIQ